MGLHLSSQCSANIDINVIAMSPAEVTEKLGMHRMRDRSWYVHPRYVSSSFAAHDISNASLAVPRRAKVYSKACNGCRRMSKSASHDSLPVSMCNTFLLFVPMNLSRPSHTLFLYTHGHARKPATYKRISLDNAIVQTSFPLFSYDSRATSPCFAYYLYSIPAFISWGNHPIYAS